MRWVAARELHGEALPNVFRKVLSHAGLDVGPKKS
jgi:A/G-specific adenine glycosylase